VNRDDVRLLKLRRELYFSLEPFRRNTRRKLRRKNLYDDLALELGFFRKEYARHPAAVKLSLHGVGASQFLAKLFSEIGHAAGKEESYMPPLANEASANLRIGSGEKQL